MARPCDPVHDLQPLGVCRWCDLYHTSRPHRDLWDATPASPARRELCLHLGDVVPTASQRTHYRCEKGHGTVCPCRECQTCSEYEADEPAQ